MKGRCDSCNRLGSYYGPNWVKIFHAPGCPVAKREDKMRRQRARAERISSMKFIEGELSCTARRAAPVEQE